MNFKHSLILAKLFFLLSLNYSLGNVLMFLGSLPLCRPCLHTAGWECEGRIYQRYGNILLQVTSLKVVFSLHVSHSLFNLHRKGQSKLMFFGYLTTWFWHFIMSLELCIISKRLNIVFSFDCLWKCVAYIPSTTNHILYYQSYTLWGIVNCYSQVTKCSWIEAI